MNEISNQGLRPLTARASTVSSKTAAAPSDNGSVKSGGNLLPPTATSEKSADSQGGNPKSISAQEKIESAVAKMNEFTQSKQRDIQFKLDKTSGRTVVTVLDRTSKAVIRQIPDEVFLKLAQDLKNQVDLQAGSGGTDGSDLHLINTSA